MDDQVLLDDQPPNLHIALTSVGQVPMDRLRSVSDGMVDGVLLVDAAGKTTYANAAMARLPGLQASGNAWAPHDRLPRRTASGPRLRRSSRASGNCRASEWSSSSAAGMGEDLFGLVAGSPITTPAGVFVGTMLNASDVSGRHAMDAQVIQTQRLGR